MRTPVRSFDEGQPLDFVSMILIMMTSTDSHDVTAAERDRYFCRPYVAEGKRLEVLNTSSAIFFWVSGIAA